jgi:hypothetical protein
MEGPLKRLLIFSDPLTNMAATGNSCFKMSNLYKGPSIDAYYQVSVHLSGFRGED